MPSTVGIVSSALALEFDSDAAAYIAAVESADTQALEAAVKTAINDFVVGCKADGIWAAIKASAILAGARTLTGALVPLKGAAPTNFNFVSGDYNRETGLVGNGSTKYLATDATGLAANVHASYYQTTTGNGGTIGNPNTDSSSVHFLPAFGLVRLTNNTFNRSTTDIGFVGGSKDASLATIRAAGTNTTQASAAGGNASGIDIFRRNVTYSSTRLAFYSIGESINLALLDARVTTLINSLGVAI